jgi:mannose-6-phosphate isomerase-like protein (cupin superfamily)
MTPGAQPRHFRPTDGTTYQLGRMTLTFKTTAPDNGGAYTLCETIEPPGSGAGLHRHVSYDETHVICEGHFDCQLGESTLKLGAGEIMFVPKGTPHSVKSVGPENGRELIISSPGGIFDAFIDEVATSIANNRDSSKPVSGAGFAAIALKYGIEFLS